MRKLFVATLIICTAIMMMPQFAFAGAWTLPQSNWWAQYYWKILYADSVFGLNEKQGKHGQSNGGKNWGYQMIPEIHFGVTDWFEPFWSITYKDEQYKEYERPPSWGPFQRKSHAFTNVDVGGKVRFLKDPFVLTGQVKGSIYTGEGQNKEPQLSDGNDSLEVKGLVGKIFGPKEMPFYFGFESGYKFNNRGVANQVPIFAEGGFWPFKWLLAKTEIDGYWAHNGTGSQVEKSYVTWRIGPVIQLHTIYYMMQGMDVTSKEFTSDITKAGRSLNFEVQYGNTFWGKNTAAYQEAVFKIYGQF